MNGRREEGGGGRGDERGWRGVEEGRLR